VSAPARRARHVRPPDDAPRVGSARLRMIPRPRRWSRWSLRRRLVVAQIGLVAATTLVAGAVAALALRGFLIDRLDTNLADASRRFHDAMMGPPGTVPGSVGASASTRPTGGPIGLATGSPSPTAVTDGRITAISTAFLDAPGQSPGTVGAYVLALRVKRAGVYDNNGKIQNLTATQSSALVALPPDRRARTRHLAGLGDYRVIAVPAPGGGILVTGLPLNAVDATVRKLANVEVLVILAALVSAAALGSAVIRVSLRPLRRVAATAVQVTQLPLDRGEVALLERVPVPDYDPGTEVGQVGAALSRLLSHVDAALSARHAIETRLRRFVADASHELRTPLAAIRGYAELTRRSPGTVPQDVVYALGRVESEAERMTILVEDLLLLARLDSGRPLVREPVDLSRLVVDVVSDAYAVSAAHQWRLDLPDEPVVVLGDADRLHQVLANLLANARMHTPPGTTVTTGLSPEPGLVSAGPGASGGATLTVVDDGPGIPPAVLPQVFERFARGDTSRSRAAGGSGLGLSIVAAVVEAHSGTVEVTSRPGRTAFVVRLPPNAPSIPPARSLTSSPVSPNA
jgi:two-component system, OmpR family, sensor kinase